MAISAMTRESSELRESDLVAGSHNALEALLGPIPAASSRAELRDVIRKYRTQRGEDSAIARAGIEGALSVVGDRYSRYLDANQSMAAIKAAAQEDQPGVGLVIAPEDEGLVVLETVNESPATRAGIQGGDMLVAIDHQSTRGMTVADARAVLNSDENTPVLLTLRRGEQERTISLVRETLQPHRVSHRRVSQNDREIGYIKIPSFGQSTDEQVKAALGDLQKVNGYVLDLRNNPGGQLSTAISVCSEFLPEGSTVVSAHYRDGHSKVYTTLEGTPRGVPVVVLVNRYSASAAEITAAALQAHGVAEVVGAPSYGKGTIQDVRRFPDFSTLRLTVADYVTPAGVSVEGKGVRPDIRVETDPTVERDEQLERALSVL